MQGRVGQRLRAIKDLHNDPSSLTLQTHAITKHKKLKEKTDNVQSDLKLRSKVNSFTLGDTNTKFFGIATSQRKSRNFTLRLLNEEGQSKVTRQQLEKATYTSKTYNMPSQRNNTITRETPQSDISSNELLANPTTQITQ